MAYDVADQKKLEVEAVLIKLSHDFSYFMDYHRYDELAELFTEDALWDRVLHVHNGRPEILEAAKARNNDVVTRHVSTNFHFTHVDERTVHGVVYNVSHYGTVGAEGRLPAVFGSAHGMLLDFHDIYRLTSQGWRLAQRIARPVLLDADSPLRSGGTEWRQADFL